MRKVGLFGNPNTGKSSIFNRLTGMNQRVGNFPGVTVDKASGKMAIDGEEVRVIDFPGTYSVFPRSKDEQVVYDVLNDPSSPDFPDAVVVVVDASNIERNLLLFSQIADYGIPAVIVMNMTDIATRNGIVINYDRLQSEYPDMPVVRSNARLGTGKSELIGAIGKALSSAKKERTAPLIKLSDGDAQSEDTERRFAKIRGLVREIVHIEERESPVVKMSPIDKWLVHPVFGYLIFFLLLLVIFQTVFTVASYPMDMIDAWFGQLKEFTASHLSPGMFTDLLTEGIISGIGGVLIFIPQIALLFFMLAILEETGYMARVVFIMDRLVRPFGLNGKSVVPLISSAACAIPGVMAARTIHSRSERLTTILVSPLMSCSARIPVYTLIIALIVPDRNVLGFLNLQGLVLFGMYALGLVAALLVAMVIKLFFRRSGERSIFLLELPSYKPPRWANVGLEVWQKVRIFVIDAGKIILAIAIVLWALASFGPGDNMEREAAKLRREQFADESSYKEAVASVKLEQSYIGIMGKAIEPAIRPLGYDWKIGIPLITSFAAREIFVGSLATIYSVHREDDNDQPLLERMRKEKHADGTPVYTFATGCSLLVFYAFAMQCMATLAIVKRETRSWKWPLIQLAYMGALAYLGALITYQLLK
jgi:ferrous iron transport protein B